MRAAQRRPEGRWRAAELNGMTYREAVCLDCGAILLSQRRRGEAHQREHDRPVEFVGLATPAGQERRRALRLASRVPAAPAP